MEKGRSTHAKSAAHPDNGTVLVDPFRVDFATGFSPRFEFVAPYPAPAGLKYGRKSAYRGVGVVTLINEEEFDIKGAEKLTGLGTRWTSEVKRLTRERAMRRAMKSAERIATTEMAGCDKRI